MKTHALMLAALIAATTNAQDSTLAQKLEKGFTAFDADHDGMMSEAEFKTLGEYSPKLKGRPEVVDYLFRELDANHDGKLSHEEYMGLEAISGGAPAPQQPQKAEVATADQTAFFEKKIRPVLAEKCYKCHAANSEKIKGGLVLDTRDGIRKGGDSGPAVVAGDVSRSLAIEAMRYTNKYMQMPPEKSGGKLGDSIIADFELWVKMGAPDPREGKAVAAKSEWDTEKAKNHWAYQPLKAVPAPVVKDTAWPKSDIDRFVLSALEAKGIKPVGDAGAEALVRRIFFDLTGLPPSPEEVHAFVSETSDLPDRVAKLAEALLQSPRFGERWARHWLDVARYAESSGKDVNCLYPHAWRYRDYVIESFNEDKPVNEFFREQIAGDLLPAKDSRDRARKQIATGFLAIGTRSLNERSPKQYALDTADEQIDAMSQAMLGLTVACARCHDHKFDPIPQRDYYGLAGIFLSTETCYGTAPTFQNNHATPLIELPTDCGLPRMPLKLDPARRAAREKELTATERYGALQFYGTALKGKLTGQGMNVNNDPQKLVMFVGINAKIGEIKTELGSYDAEGYPKLLAMGVRDFPATPASGPTTKPKSVTEAFDLLSGRPAQFRSIGDSPLLARGDVEKPGDKVPRGFVSVITSNTPVMPAKQSGRRELADWLVADENPLTSRVFVNRVWHWLFGRGIVSTVDNFGTMGQAPANAALLDHLALRFEKSGWSLKSLIKDIVTSRVYQLAASYDEKRFEADPENALVWRMTPRRLDAECIRDAMLAVGGGLVLQPPAGSAVAQHGDAAIGGFLIKTMRQPLSDDVFLNASNDYRSIYLPVPRNAVPDALTTFDFAEPSAVNGSREVTTVPSQALYLLNNEFVTRQAARFAARLAALEPGRRIAAAFQTAFARAPSAGEEHAAQRFFEGANRDDAKALTSFCRALLSSAEFRSID